jgi:acyl carrier protein
MTHEEVLKAICEEVWDLQTDPHISSSEQLTGQMVIETINLTSLEMLQLILNLEDKLSISLTVGDFPKTSTLSQVAEHISRLKEKRLKDTG